VTNDQVFVVASFKRAGDSGRDAALAYEQIADVLCSRGLEVVQERVFGSLGAQTSVITARAAVLDARSLRSNGPLTYVQGHPVWGAGLAGIIIHAVHRDRLEAPVRIVTDEGLPAGRTWRCGHATFAILQNIQGLSTELKLCNSPAEQAKRILERAERVLHTCGMSYAHTVRTWFYLADILSWYAEFNQVRSEKYEQMGLMPRPEQRQILLPASTGISGDPPGQAAAAMDLIAVRPDEHGGPMVRRVGNPRQKEAFRYGSAFSRCAVVASGRGSLIQLSGTAAIDEAGQSLCPGDVRAQAKCTLDRVAALLDQEQAGLPDICAATLFVKHCDHADIVREVLAEFGLERFPAVYVVADVCRDELLFEIDAEVVLPASSVG
jgi:enamine deaminase RidA (YjgF/YER057c/UK114 family)